MFKIVLYQPEIPPNTGNIIRLCANTGAELHLIEPLGFEMDNTRLKRAGLDYHELARVRYHPDWSTFSKIHTGNIFAFTTKANQFYTDVAYQPGDALLFGPETRGLPIDIRDLLSLDHQVRIPMVKGSRSLNLANAVSLGLYEAWRQTGFDDGQ